MSNAALNAFIASLIDNDSRVLDLGCGDGELLAYLRQKRGVNGYGVEIDFDSVLSCTEKGLSVFQGDLEEGLREFQDGSFDYVILSQTMQQIKRPLPVLKEMLRVGKLAVVTFPNFAYWRIRLQLFLGISPRTRTLPFAWYDSPNIRVITIKDFDVFAREKDLRSYKKSPFGRHVRICHCSRR